MSLPTLTQNIVAKNGTNTNKDDDATAYKIPIGFTTINCIR